MNDIFTEWLDQLGREILVHTELLECVARLPPALTEGAAPRLHQQLDQQRQLTAKVQAVRHRRQSLRSRSRREFGCDTIARLIPHAPLPMQPQLTERRERLHEILTQLSRHQDLAQQLMRTHLSMLNELLGVVSGQPAAGAYGRQGRATASGSGGSLLNLQG